jgi:hypothetical protein
MVMYLSRRLFLISAGSIYLVDFMDVVDGMDWDGFGLVFGWLIPLLNSSVIAL